MIGRQEYLFDEPESNFWNFIKIEPVKWMEKTMGNEGGGFWVVAVFGNRVLYYNDIEEGFNISLYSSYGEIAEYSCEQSDLYDSVVSIFNGLKNPPYWFI